MTRTRPLAEPSRSPSASRCVFRHRGLPIRTLEQRRRPSRRRAAQRRVRGMFEACSARAQAVGSSPSSRRSHMPTSVTGARCADPVDSYRRPIVGHPPLPPMANSASAERHHTGEKGDPRPGSSPPVGVRAGCRDIKLVGGARRSSARRAYPMPRPASTMTAPATAASDTARSQEKRRHQPGRRGRASRPPRRLRDRSPSTADRRDRVARYVVVQPRPGRRRTARPPPLSTHPVTASAKPSASAAASLYSTPGRLGHRGHGSVIGSHGARIACGDGDGRQHGVGLVPALRVFGRRVGVGDQAGASLDVDRAVSNDRGADRDRGVEVAGEVDVADHAAVQARAGSARVLR